ncbi:hypothetical protein Ancab_031699 [Ancistrocladus abbreviatus]
MAQKDEEHTKTRLPIAVAGRLRLEPYLGVAHQTTELPPPPAQTPSPAEAGQMKDVLRRLEEINTESQALLKRLFSMLNRDARLERYIKSRLEDPKVSHMWELVEQILATNRGPVNFDELMTASSDDDSMDKSVKTSESVGDDTDGTHCLERFKVRTLDPETLISKEGEEDEESGKKRNSW